MFSKETYQNRRKVLQEKMSDGILLFMGNTESPMNFAANPYPFRQDSSFLYYFGIQEPKLVGLIDLDKGTSIVFGNELDIDEIVWMGTQETLKAKAEKSGVEESISFEKLAEYVEKAKNKGRKIHYLPPYRPENKILLSRLLKQSIKELTPSVELIKAMVSQRSIKEEQEVVQIEQSVNITNAMHLLTMRKAKAGIKEYELYGAIQKWATSHNCGFSYPPIITTNGQILHNHYRGNTLKEGDMVLNDSGVENPMGYAGDLTRTFPVGIKFTSRQREIYEIVHQAFSEAPKMMKPGVDYKEVHRKAAEILTEGLINVGIMKGNPKEAVKSNAHSLFFQTGVGHMMGLDVHDMEDLGEEYVGYTDEDPKDTQTFGWKSLRLGKPLEAGYVLTVEPGIYFIPQLIDQWEAVKKLSEFIDYEKLQTYRDFGGIRIEDNYLITDRGYRRLGDGLISTADEIEAYRAEHLS